MLKRILMLCLFIVSSHTLAADSPDLEKVRATFAKNVGLKVNSVANSPVPGLLAVFTERGLFYVTEDGNFMVYGKIFDLNNGLANVNEMAISPLRLEGMKSLEDSMIVYPAENEKHQITVFTDLSCGYCRRMHTQMKGYNELGITVKYLAFPRAGLGSEDANNIRSVFCAKDPNKAMDEAKLEGTVVAAQCDLPIAEHYIFGQRVGINATPSVILEDGSMIPGYRSPADMSRLLGG